MEAFLDIKVFIQISRQRSRIPGKYSGQGRGAQTGILRVRVIVVVCTVRGTNRVCMRIGGDPIAFARLLAVTARCDRDGFIYIIDGPTSVVVSCAFVAAIAAVTITPSPLPVGMRASVVRGGGRQDPTTTCMYIVGWIIGVIAALDLSYARRRMHGIRRHVRAIRGHGRGRVGEVSRRNAGRVVVVEVARKVAMMMVIEVVVVVAFDMVLVRMRESK